MDLVSVVAEMGVGGAEAVVATTTRAVLADGGRARVVSSGGWRADELAGEGATIVELPMRGIRPGVLARGARMLQRQLEQRPPDIVHAHNVKAACVARLALRGRSRPPLVVTVHGVADRRYPTAARILRRVADRAVAVSDDVADRLTAEGFPLDRLTVVENAVTPPRTLRTPRTRRRARCELDLPDDAPVVLCSARLVPQKRHDLLVGAWAAMPPDAVLLVAGDGPTRDAVTTAVEAAGLTGRVRLLGTRSDVDVLLAAADLLVLPSDWEGLPISVLEAMASGVPVVASDVVGLHGLAAAAHLVSPGSQDALAAGMRTVVGNAELRDDLVRRGHELVVTRFHPDTMLAGYRRVYDEAREQRRRFAR